MPGGASPAASHLAELLESGGVPVETKLDGAADPVLRSVLHLDGDVVTHVSPALLGTPEMARALVLHEQALAEVLGELAVFLRSFARLRPVFQWLGLLAPPTLDFLVERHWSHALVTLAGSGASVLLASILKSSSSRRNAGAVADAVRELRRRR